MSSQTSGITLKATQADGFYYDPDFDPNVHKNLDNFARKRGFEHHLGKDRVKNLDRGILQVRFEMPFKIKCLNCQEMIGVGSRFDADKKRVGNYYTSPIYEFTMHCGQIVDPKISVDNKTHCNNVWKIRTDPKNNDYALVQGCERTQQGHVGGTYDKKGGLGTIEQNTALDPVYMDLDAKRKMQTDPMFKLEVLHKQEIRKKKAERERFEFEKGHSEDLAGKHDLEFYQKGGFSSSSSSSGRVLADNNDVASTSSKRQRIVGEECGALRETSSSSSGWTRDLDPTTRSSTSTGAQKKGPPSGGEEAPAGSSDDEDEDGPLLQQQRSFSQHRPSVARPGGYHGRADKQVGESAEDRYEFLLGQNALSGEEKRGYEAKRLETLYRMQKNRHLNFQEMNSAMRAKLRAGKKQANEVEGRKKVFGDFELLKTSKTVDLEGYDEAFGKKSEFERLKKRMKLQSEPLLNPRSASSDKVKGGGDGVAKKAGAKKSTHTGSIHTGSTHIAKKNSDNWKKMEEKYLLFQACQKNLFKKKPKG